MKSVFKPSLQTERLSAFTVNVLVTGTCRQSLHPPPPAPLHPFLESPGNFSVPQKQFFADFFLKTQRCVHLETLYVKNV